MESINWTKLEEDFERMYSSELNRAFRPDSIPDNIREWVKFIEQYEHIISLPDDFDPSFEGIRDEDVDNLKNEHLYLNKGYKKSPVECWRDTDKLVLLRELFIKHGVNLDKCAKIALFFDRMKTITIWSGYKLDRMPKHVSGNVRADACGLTSLEGFPETIGGLFNCSENKLTSLKGGPRKVGGFYECSDNPLKNFIGGPTEVGEGFKYNGDTLESLEGSPKKCASFYIQSESLTSLKNGPETVIYNYIVGGCNALVSLEGMTQDIGKNINIRGVSFESTKGIPPIIVGELNFTNSAIKYLDGIKSVGTLNGIRSNLQPCTLPKITGFMGDVHLDGTPYATQSIKQNESVILTYKQFKNDC